MFKFANTYTHKGQMSEPVTRENQFDKKILPVGLGSDYCTCSDELFIPFLQPLNIEIPVQISLCMSRIIRHK